MGGHSRLTPFCRISKFIYIESQVGWLFGLEPVVPTRISCLFFPTGFFSGCFSNHKVCQWLPSSQFVSFVCAVIVGNVNMMVLYYTWIVYTCSFCNTVSWCLAKLSKINQMAAI